MGKPVVRGARVTVELILEKMGAGESVDQILEAHPRLNRKGVLAALKFGAEALRADVAYPLSKEAMDAHGKEMANAFTVISPGQIRIRREI